MITQKRLKELLSYNPRTGVMRWTKPRKKVIVGAIVGCLRPDGAINASVDGKIYLLHRLAWLYMTGEWPKQSIDHIDGRRSNNRFSNLRDVSKTVNMQNMRKATAQNKSSGVIGVHRNPRKNGWVAHIRINGKPTHIGCFKTIKMASMAYIEAKRKHHEGCTI